MYLFIKYYVIANKIRLTLYIIYLTYIIYYIYHIYNGTIFSFLPVCFSTRILNSMNFSKMSLLFLRKTISQYQVLSSTNVAKYLDPDNDSTRIGLQMSVCTNCNISKLVILDLSNGIRASFPCMHTSHVHGRPYIFFLGETEYTYT